jgi:large repetitive protein
VTVNNQGTQPYTGATFTDNLAGVLDRATMTGTPSASSGMATVSGSILTWHGNVPAGGTVTVTYQVTVN